MIPYTPLTCYRDTPLCAPACSVLKNKGFLFVWVWQSVKQFIRLLMIGDRMSKRCEKLTKCHGVSGPFPNTVHSGAVGPINT